MQTGGGQERRDRGIGTVYSLVGQDENRGALGNSPVRRAAQFLQGPRSRPALPSAALKRIGSVTDLCPGRSSCRSLASSAFFRMGMESRICRQFSGPGCSRFPCGTKGDRGGGDELFPYRINGGDWSPAQRAA